MKRDHRVIAALAIILLAAGIGQAQLTITDENDPTCAGCVGVKTSSPSDELHVVGKIRVDAEFPKLLFSSTGTSGAVWDFKVNGNTGRWTITDDPTDTRIPLKFAPGADHNIFRVGVLAQDTVDINGKLVVNGYDITPDYVFGSDYQLESIDEHARIMWTENHLPAVAPAQAGADGRHRIDLGARSQGMLEELEKAHIYIEQLHHNLGELNETVAEQQQLIHQLSARLDAIDTTEIQRTGD